MAFGLGKKKETVKPKTEAQLRREEELRRIEEELRRLDAEREEIEEEEFLEEDEEEAYTGLSEDPEHPENRLVTIRFFLDGKPYDRRRIRVGMAVAAPEKPEFDNPDLVFKKWWPEVAYVAAGDADYYALYSDSTAKGIDHYIERVKDVNLGYQIRHKGDEQYTSIVLFTEFTKFSGIINIPDTIDGLPVKSIANGAFWNSRTLTGISLPKHLVTIGEEAFAGCRKLVRVSFENGVKTIRKRAFQGCTKLALVQLPESIRVIDDEAFAGCDLLKKVIVPREAEIGEKAFPPGTEVVET